MIYLELFLTFFLIGMFTIGGGYSMLPLIQNQVVNVHGWIDETTFTDIVAISQMTPGPIGIIRGLVRIRSVGVNEHTRFIYSHIRSSIAIIYNSTSFMQGL